MPPFKSFVWLYMEKVSAERVQCKLCGTQYTSNTGTSAMRKHIQMKHPEESETIARYESSKETVEAFDAGEIEGSEMKEIVVVSQSDSFSATGTNGADGRETDVNFEVSDSETITLGGQQSFLTSGGSTRKNASIVWHFMTRVGPKEIVCNICHRHFSFDGSTSNMHRHVRKDHPNELAQIMAGETVTLPSGLEPNQRAATTATTSKNMSSGNEGENLCGHDEEYMPNFQMSFSGKTPKTEKSMSAPLINLPASFAPGKVKKRIQWGFKRKNASIVWQFMARVGLKDIICQLCQKRFSFDGSTSNMRKHLKKEHPEELSEVMGGGTIMLPASLTVRKSNGTQPLKGKGGVEESMDEEDPASDSDEDYSPNSTRKKPQGNRFLVKAKRKQFGRVMKKPIRLGFKRKNASIIWQLIAKVNPRAAVCQLCNKRFSFDGSTSNMHRHLRRDHTEELAIVTGGGTVTMPFAVTEDSYDSKGDILYEETRRPFPHGANIYFRKRPTSLIWKFMERTGQEKAVCKFCQKEFNYIGSTSNMRKHLKFSHPGEYSKVLSGGSVDWNTLTLTSSSPVKPAGRNKPSGSGANQLDNLALMAVGNLYPCSLDLVESEGFLKFMHVLNPNFFIPDRTVLETTITKLYNKHLDLLQEQLDEAPGISISTEIWTYRDEHKYMTVTGHLVSEVWELRSVVLKTVPLDGCSDLSASIAERLEQVLQERNISQKVKCIVSENCEEVTSAFARLNIPHLQCIAHSLNLMIQQALRASSDIRCLVKRVRDIASFFLHSSEASENLRELQKSEGKDPVKLLLHAESDWIGTHKMFQRYMELHNTLGLVLNQINKEDILLVADELELLSRCLQTLEPFTFAAEDMISDGYTTLSKSIPVFEILHQMMTNLLQLETQSESASAFIKELSGHVDRCRSVVGDRSNFLPWATSLLDPRFKQIVTEDPDIHRWVETQLQQMIEPREATTEQEPQMVSKATDADAEANVSLLWSAFDETIKKSALEEPVDELQRYIEERPITRQENPLEWWMEREHLYPRLCRQVKQFLCIPATAVPASQLFSQKEKLKTSLRNFLEEPYVDTILFLNSCQIVKL